MWKLARRKAERADREAVLFRTYSFHLPIYIFYVVHTLRWEGKLYLFSCSNSSHFNFSFRYLLLLFLRLHLSVNVLCWWNNKIMIKFSCIVAIIYPLQRTTGYGKPEKDDNIIKFGVLKHIMLHIIIALLLCSRASSPNTFVEEKNYCIINQF